MDDFESGDRRLYRKSFADRVADPETDFEICSEVVHEILESADGAVEETERVSGIVLACGHTGRPGQLKNRCEACSEERGHTAFVCGLCSVRCAECGRLFCMKHSRLAGDNKRYCAKCLRRLPRELRGHHAHFGSSTARGLLSWLLEWW